MEPHEILTLVRRFTPLLLAHLVLGAIVGYSIAYFSPPVYTSKASALVAADGNGTQSVSSSSTLISAVMPTLVQLGTSQPVLDDVAASTGVDPSEVSHAITVTNPPNPLLIEVSAEASSPEKAQMIAQAEIKALRKVVGDMSVKVQEEAALTLSDIDVASRPAGPSGPSRTRYLLYGSILGTAVGAGVCSYLYILSRINNRQQAEIAVPAVGY